MRVLPFDKFEKSLEEIIKAEKYMLRCREKLGIELNDYFQCTDAACELLGFIFGKEYKVIKKHRHDPARELYDFLVKNKKEYSMPAKVFIEYMNIIKEEISVQDEFRKLGFDVFGHMNTVDVLISLMEFAIGDETGGVSWWVYEKDFGKEGVEAYDADDNVVPTDTAEELYLYLTGGAK